MDILDTQGDWFLGTVLKLREAGKPPNTVKECYVCFRVYMEDGTKLDNRGRKHEGWSEQYDTWLPAYSVRLQRYLYS